MWDQIEALDNKAPAECQTRMLLQTVRTLWRTTPWFLHNCAHPLDITSLIEEFHEGVQRISAALDDILSPDQLRDTAERAKRYALGGVPPELSTGIGRLKVLSSAPDIVRIADATGQKVEDTGAAYFLIGDRFKLDWLRRTAGALPVENHWHRLALGAIIDDMWSHQKDLTAAALASGETGLEAVKSWASSRFESVDRVEQLLTEIISAPVPDLAMLAVANRELRTLSAL
jgi:glutamate dehydrogenase